MREVIIEKTGNFWIDNGIVGLYKSLREMEMLSEQYDVHLTCNSLIITSNSDDVIIADILNAAKEFAAKNYLTQTNGAGWIFKDGKFSVYRKTDFKMHLKPFFTGKIPQVEGALLVPEAKDSDLGGKGRRMTEDEYLDFMRFKEENSPVIINDKKSPLTGKGFINNAPQYEIGADFNGECLIAGSKRCVFTGKMYKYAGGVSGMDYPFLTGASGELNFASYLKNKPVISSLYSFIALFSFLNIHYLLQDDLMHYFVLYDGDLKELSSFYNTITGNVQELKHIDYCNFETEIIGTVYDSECFFNFLLSVYKQIKSRVQKDERKGRFFSKAVFSMTNDGNIFKDVKEYTSLSALFDLFDSYEADGDKNYLDTFMNFVYYFSKRLDSGKYDTTWRNRLCNDILYFRSIHKIIERYLGEVKLREDKGNIIYLDKIIEIYNLKTQNNMKTEMVDICKTVGNRIGAYCREKEDKGILFSIRNAKSRMEFINVLAETQFRTNVSYSDTFFKELPDNAQWEEYKALVSIFAMNSFLFKKVTND